MTADTSPPTESRSRTREGSEMSDYEWIARGTCVLDRTGRQIMMVVPTNATMKQAAMAARLIAEDHNAAMADGEEEG